MKVRQLTKVLVWNAVLFFVLLEAVGVAAYWIRTRTFYYTSHPGDRAARPEQLEGLVEAYRIHPYLGFIVRPSARSRSVDKGHHYNNHGFDTPFDYPYLRRDAQEFLIGIFGGSAASKLAVYEAQEQVLGAALAQKLERPLAEITVLNFAQGGFKQPQQLLTYEYLASLGQDLDLVINFDGFNEVALTSRNAVAGVSVDMPSFEHVRALQEMTALVDSSEGIETMLRVRRDWARYSALHNRAWSGTAWETTFASGFLLDWLVYRFYHRRYLSTRLASAGSEADQHRATDSWFYITRDAPTGDVPEEGLASAQKQAIDLWARSTRQLARAVQADGDLYLHFLQPNQYFPTARDFSEEERKVAISPDSPYSQAVAAAYPRLAARVEVLRVDGVPVEALFDLLDTLEAPAYVDDCCHFTDAAQRRLLEHIGDAAVEALADQSM